MVRKSLSDIAMGKDISGSSKKRIEKYVKLVDSIDDFPDWVSPEEEEKAMNESSLNRLIQHIKLFEAKSWAIMASWRSNNFDTKNDFGMLKNKLTHLGLHYIIMVGHEQDEDENDSIKPNKEPVLFVKDITLEQALKLASHYNQNGIMYSGPESDKAITLYASDGRAVKRTSTLTPSKIAEFFSEIKGKPFMFERLIPDTQVEAYFNYMSTK